MHEAAFAEALHIQKRARSPTRRWVLREDDSFTRRLEVTPFKVINTGSDWQKRRFTCTSAGPSAGRSESPICKGFATLKKKKGVPRSLFH